jgi:hypothetical protein
MSITTVNNGNCTQYITIYIFEKSTHICSMSTLENAINGIKSGNMIKKDVISRIYMMLSDSNDKTFIGEFSDWHNMLKNIKLSKYNVHSYDDGVKKQIKEDMIKDGYSFLPSTKYNQSMDEIFMRHRHINETISNNELIIEAIDVFKEYLDN